MVASSTRGRQWHTSTTGADNVVRRLRRSIRLNRAGGLGDCAQQIGIFRRLDQNEYQLHAALPRRASALYCCASKIKLVEPSRKSNLRRSASVSPARAGECLSFPP